VIYDEDWSNDENSALITGINYILKYFKKKTITLGCFNFCLYFD